MRTILLLIAEDTDARNQALEWSKKIASLYAQNASHTSFRIITFSSSNEKVLEVQQNSTWLSVKEVVCALAREESFHTTSPVRRDNLATCLHETADSLPYLGSDLHILFFMGVMEENINRQSFISVAGALRRLVEWHNGHAVMIPTGQALSQIGHQLAEFAHCQMIGNIDDVKIPFRDWTGKVAVKDHIEEKGHVFPGFWLESENWNQVLHHKFQIKRCAADECMKTRLKRKMSNETGCDMSSARIVCGRTMDILQEVDLRTFPLYLMDSWTLKLSVNQSQSKTLIRYIQEQQMTGLLARLPVYPGYTEIPICGNMPNINTVAWKEKIITDYQHLEDSDEDMNEDMEYLYLLLLPGPKPSSASQFVRARVLLSQHEINADIFHVLEDRVKKQIYSTKSEREQEKKTEMYGASQILVLEQRDTFAIMLDLLKENYQNTLQEYKSTSGSREDFAPELLETLAEKQTKILANAFSNSGNLQDHVKAVKQKIGPQIKWVSEACMDPSKFPEKLALKAKDASKKSLLNFPSADSLSAMSPLSLADLEKKKNSIDFDVSDVLQLFNPDGSHKILPNSPTKLKGHSLCRMESQPDLKLSWPESQLLQYHDIYYYHDKTDLLLEKKYAKIRDSGYLQDTHSSFVSPVKKRPQTKPLSPVRRSPRRSASAQHLMTRCRSDGLQSIPARKPSPIESLFKQPTARSHSPRKRLIANTSISGPDLSHSGSGPKRKLPSESSNFTANRDMENTAQQKCFPSRQKTKDNSSSSSSNTAASFHETKSETFIKHQKKSPAVLAIKSDAAVRKSPRKLAGSFGRTKVSDTPSRDKEDDSTSDVSNTTDKDSSLIELTKKTPASSTKDSSVGKDSAKMKRSQRHKMKLQRIIDHVLQEKGIKPGDTIHSACSRNLFNVSLVLLKTLTTSQNLTEEMKTVVYGQVTQIINLEKRRCGIKL